MSPTNKTDRHNITEILLKVALNTINQTRMCIKMEKIKHFSAKINTDYWWFSRGTPVSSTNKTDCHDITEILLKVA
jgi:DNA polymerase III psi subunit